MLVAQSCPTPWPQAPLFMGFPRQECWNGLPFPSPRGLPDPGIEPYVSCITGGFFMYELPGKPQLRKPPSVALRRNGISWWLIHSSQHDEVGPSVDPFKESQGQRAEAVCPRSHRWQVTALGIEFRSESRDWAFKQYCTLPPGKIEHGHRGCKDLLCTRLSSPRNKIGMKLPLQSELRGRRKSLILKSLKYIHIKPELIALKDANPSHITCYLSREGKHNPHLTSV